MSRRCKPGIRARVIGGRNVGKIVHVVRYYFGEDLNGAQWPEPLFPWVVTSLGSPLRSIDMTTLAEQPPSMTIVIDDCNLEPLRDDDEFDSGAIAGLTQRTGKAGGIESLPRSVTHNTQI